MGWRPTGEILACLKSPIPHCPAPRPSLPFSSPSSISAERKDRWQREGLAGSLRSLLSYFHKPIIAHHLGRLRPCLSPIQPGGRGRGKGEWGDWAARCSSTGITTCAFTRLPWERSVGAVLGWSLGVGHGGWRSTLLHPSVPREGAGSCVLSPRC